MPCKNASKLVVVLDDYFKTVKILKYNKESEFPVLAKKST